VVSLASSPERGPTGGYPSVGPPAGNLGWGPPIGVPRARSPDRVPESGIPKRSPPCDLPQAVPTKRFSIGSRPSGSRKGVSRKMFSRNGVLQGAPPKVFPKRFQQWGSRKVFPTTGISQEDSGKGLIRDSRKGFPARSIP
jgi:hypothetical protein